MPLSLSHTTFDAHDPHAIAEFWRQLLTWDVQEPESHHPCSDECYLVSPHGYTVLFLKNTDLKTVKNRAHFDLVPTDSSSRGAEIDRAQQLGATIVDDRRHDLGCAVLADPEGMSSASSTTEFAAGAKRAALVHRPQRSFSPRRAGPDAGPPPSSGGSRKSCAH